VKRKTPSVVRRFEPDEEAQDAALRLLYEQSGTPAGRATVVRRAGYSNSEERRLQTSSRGPKDQYEPLRD